MHRRLKTQWELQSKSSVLVALAVNTYRPLDAGEAAEREKEIEHGS